MKDAREAIEALGGLTAVARALGHRNPTTVQKWSASNRISPNFLREFTALLDAQGLKYNVINLVCEPEE